MKIKNILSKESLASSLKNLGKLRIRVSHGSVMTYTALFLILFTALAIRIFPLRWEIESGSVHLSEFDPYFQYRFTEYIVNNGFVSWAWPTQWVDKQRWYPDGINVAATGFPGLPFTAAFLYNMVSALGVNIDLMAFCALLAPIMGMLASLAIYFLGKDIGGKPMGLIAALFLALSPSYIQRSSVGWFDDEIIGIVALLMFIITFLRAIEEDRSLSSSVKYAVVSGLTLGYFCAGWGAAYYPIGATALFVFALILLRRYSQRLLLSYGLTFGLGLFIAMNVPKLGPAYLLTTPVLPVAGILAALCLYELTRALTSTKLKVTFIIGFLIMLIAGFALISQLGYLQGIAGKFWSVLDPSIRSGSPLTESVAEHRMTAWGSVYFEFGITIIFFIAGIFFVSRNPNNKNLFLLIFGLTSLYFANSMVRLLVLMAPASALLIAYGVTGTIKSFNTLLREPPKIGIKKRYSLEHVGKEFSGVALLLIFLLLMTNIAFPMPKVYRQVYTPITITAASLPIVPSTPVRQWLNMLEYTRNLGATTVVCSWWDYGYWLTVLGNVTSLADNATVDLTQIQNIGFIYIANDTQAVKMLKTYDAKYVLIFITIDVNGNWAGYGDEGKWAWMARISGGGNARLIEGGFMDPQSAWTSSVEDVVKFGNQTIGFDSVDSNGDGQADQSVANPKGQNTTLCKLMVYARNRWLEVNQNSTKPAELEYFKEAYIAGLDLSAGAASSYGNLVPLVGLFEVKYPNV